MTPLILFVALASGVLSAPVDPHTELLKSVCQGTLRKEGLTEYYARNIAHRLHSITAEDIALHFGVQVGDENTIPTVNNNLTSEERLLSYAPRANYDNYFTSDALKYLDMILRDMDKKHYSITNFSVLEKIAHALHMAELWSRAGVHYRALLLNPPSRETCLCAGDSVLTGIEQELNLLALKIKFPGLTSGEYEKIQEMSKAGYDIDYTYGKADQAPAPGYDIDYSLGRRRRDAGVPPPGYDIDYSYGKMDDPSKEFQEKLMKFDFSGKEEDVVERVSKELVDGDHGMATHLDSEQGWAYWKEKMTSMAEIGNYEFALFMYCKLN